LAGWTGIADQHTGIGFVQLVRARLNIAPPTLFVLSAGSLVYVAWPRLAPAIAFGLVASRSS
jgi:hypothetical protein